MHAGFLMVGSISFRAHLHTGRSGEEVAANYLCSLGYQIYGRNVRLGHDEIDILAFDPTDHVLVFAEVKTRSKFDQDFTPLLDLTVSKKKKLRRSARSWIDAFGYEGGYRIDALLVAAGCVCSHYKEVMCDFDGA